MVRRREIDLEQLRLRYKDNVNALGLRKAVGGSRIAQLFFQESAWSNLQVETGLDAKVAAPSKQPTLSFTGKKEPTGIASIYAALIERNDISPSHAALARAIIDGDGDGSRLPQVKPFTQWPVFSFPRDSRKSHADGDGTSSCIPQRRRR